MIYTFRARWAEQFSKGRVVLAGDALHLMPPFLGQGLNSGFRDAAALSWRLPLMLSGVARPETMLRSYQEERLEHVRDITLHCIKLGSVVCETDPLKAKQIHADLRQSREREKQNVTDLQPPSTFTTLALGRLAS